MLEYLLILIVITIFVGFSLSHVDAVLTELLDLEASDKKKEDSFNKTD